MLDDASSHKLSTSTVTAESIFSIAEKRTSQPFSFMSSSPKRFKDIELLETSSESERCVSRIMHEKSSNISKEPNNARDEPADCDLNQTHKNSNGSQANSSSSSNEVVVNKRKKKPTKSNESITKLIDEEESINEDCDYELPEYTEESHKNRNGKESPAYDEFYENGNEDELKENHDLQMDKSSNGISSQEDISDECHLKPCGEAENDDSTVSQKLTPVVRLKSDKLTKDLRLCKASHALMISKLMKSRGILNARLCKKTDKLTNKSFDKSRALPKYLSFNKLKAFHSTLAERKILNSSSFPIVKQKTRKPTTTVIAAYDVPPSAPVKVVASQEAAPGVNKKKQMRYQCRFCSYKSHSVSLMQNHIYRHIDKTPYSCYYCGHKSTTKSTIMVHIELCHPNMEVKIEESRVKEEEYFVDLNAAQSCDKSSAIGCYETCKASEAKQSFSENLSNKEEAASMDSDNQNSNFANSRVGKKKQPKDTQQDEEENAAEQLPHFLSKAMLQHHKQDSSKASSSNSSKEFCLDQRSQKSSAEYCQPSQSSSPRGLSMINGNLTKTVFSEQGSDPQESLGKLSSSNHLALGH